MSDISFTGCYVVRLWCIGALCLVVCCTNPVQRTEPTVLSQDQPIEASGSECLDPWEDDL